MRTVTAVKMDYYELLGVPPDADTEEIRAAFHAAAMDVIPTSPIPRARSGTSAT